MDWRNEALLTLREAIQVLPNRNGKQLHISQIHRWIHNGLVNDGERVRLEFVKIGGTVFTSQEAIDRFIVGCSAPAVPPTQPTSERRKRASLKKQAEIAMQQIAAMKELQRASR